MGEGQEEPEDQQNFDAALFLRNQGGNLLFGLNHALGQRLEA
jgi:hypothetical protein